MQGTPLIPGIFQVNLNREFLSDTLNVPWGYGFVSYLEMRDE